MLIRPCKGSQQALELRERQARESQKLSPVSLKCLVCDHAFTVFLIPNKVYWRTGALFTTAGEKRAGALFVRHLHELRGHWRRYRKVHVICDNAKFHHDCWAVWEFGSQYGDRVVLHFLPKYAPELNPIERVGWILHDQITRNHQCKDLPELVDLALPWLADRKRFAIDAGAYPPCPS